MEELQELVETAKHAVSGVDAAIAAAVDRKLNPVSHIHTKVLAVLGVIPCVCCSAFIRCLACSTVQRSTSFAAHIVCSLIKLHLLQQYQLSSDERLAPTCWSCMLDVLTVLLC